MTVYVLPKGTELRGRWDGLPVFDVTTGGSTFRPLSPMLLGPVQLYGGLVSENMENAWQYAKVYPQFEAPDRYWPWAVNGWGSPRANRHPLGKGARPMYSLWAGEQLGYIEARKRIYIPLYAHAVRFGQLMLFAALKQQAQAGDIALLDFDAYDHREYGYNWECVINDERRKMGHAFVLAMMIEGVL